MIDYSKICEVYLIMHGYRTEGVMEDRLCTAIEIERHALAKYMNSKRMLYKYTDDDLKQDLIYYYIESTELGKRKWSVYSLDVSERYSIGILDLICKIDRETVIEEMLLSVPLFEFDMNKVIGEHKSSFVPFLKGMAYYRDRKSVLAKYVAQFFKMNAKEFEELSGINWRIFDSEIRKARRTRGLNVSSGASKRNSARKNCSLWHRNSVE